MAEFVEVMRYCPSCGTKMDGGTDDERSESAMAG